MTTLTPPASGASTAPSSAKNALEIRESGRMVLVRVLQPLDLDLSQTLHERVRAYIAARRCLVLDLHQTDYVDSSGVRAVMQLQSAIAAASGELRLVIQTGSRVERVFSLLRLLDQFQVYPSVAEAWNKPAGGS